MLYFESHELRSFENECRPIYICVNVHIRSTDLACEIQFHMRIAVWALQGQVHTAAEEIEDLRLRKADSIRHLTQTQFRYQYITVIGDLLTVGIMECWGHGAV